MDRRESRGLPAVVVGAIALTLAVVIVFAAFTRFNPLASPFELKAAFRTANDVKAGSPVRIAGVTVGKVTKVEAADETGAGAIVTMQIEDAGLPIHDDAMLKIRPRIFLEGNFFVELRPGSPSAPEVDDGDTIPVAQTSAPVQFGQFLAALQSDTRQDLRISLQQFGRSLTTRGGAGAAGFNRSIPFWAPAHRDSAITNDAARGLLERDLSGYIRYQWLVSQALARNRRALPQLVTDVATTSGALAQEQASLGAAIAELPRFIERGNGALAALNDAFPPVRALVADLRPAVRSELPALQAQLPFIQQASGLVSEPELRGLAADLRPTVPDLVKLNEGGVPFQRQLRLLSSCQNEVVLPWANSRVVDEDFPATGPVFEEQVKWLPGIAGESRSFDANGQFIKTFAQTANYAYPINDGRFYMTEVPLTGVNPPKAPMSPMRPDVACETQEPADLESRAVAPPAGIKVNPNATEVIPASGRSAGDGSGAPVRVNVGRRRYEAAKRVAVRELQELVQREGLDLAVTDGDLRHSDARLVPAPGAQP